KRSLCLLSRPPARARIPDVLLEVRVSSTIPRLQTPSARSGTVQTPRARRQSKSSPTVESRPNGRLDMGPNPRLPVDTTPSHMPVQSATRHTYRDLHNRPRRAEHTGPLLQLWLRSRRAVRKIVRRRRAPGRSSGYSY